MVAVSFFFVLMGSSLLFIGIMGIFLSKILAQDDQWLGKQKKNLIIIAGIGTVCLILGMLMAMT